MRGLLVAMACAVALFFVAPTAHAQAGPAPDGVLRLQTELAPLWKLEGSPPRLFLCMRTDMHTGGFTSTSTCHEWGSAQAYLERRYPGKGAILTNWILDCEAI